MSLIAKYMPQIYKILKIFFSGHNFKCDIQAAWGANIARRLYNIANISTARIGENKMFIPHKHTCEIKLCHPVTWKNNCPLHGKLTETEDECENCKHFVIIEFNSENPVHIEKVIHVNV